VVLCISISLTLDIKEKEKKIVCPVKQLKTLLFVFFQIRMLGLSLLKTSLINATTKNVLPSVLPMQPVRTAFLYESRFRVNIMKRMSIHGAHNHLGRKKGQVYLWEKLIRGEEVVVGL